MIDSGGRVVGIVTNRDLRFETNLGQPVKNIMTPRSRLVTVREGATREDAMALMHKHRLERVLVVTKNFDLRGLIRSRISRNRPSIRTPARISWAACAWALRSASAKALKSAQPP